MSKRTYNLAFVLGREIELAKAELEATALRFDFCFNITRITGNVVFAKVDLEVDRLGDFFKLLAGTIKVFELVPCTNLATESLALLKSNQLAGKLNFGFSDYTKKHSINELNKVGLQLKSKLKPRSSRFIELKDHELSGIVSLKNRLFNKGIEIGIFDGFLGSLIFLNNPEDWAKRDYGKPKGDKFSGMAPPKLARMLVNIAVCDAPKKLTARSNNLIIADPFCGSGNIAIEAALEGFPVIASDISEKAVNDAQINLDWLAKNFQQFCSIKQFPKHMVFKADATTKELIEKWQLEVGKSDSLMVVSEPYLGRPKKYSPTLREAESEYLKVANTYLKFLANIRTVSNFATICLVFPLVETSDNKQFSLFSNCVDEIKKMGYTQIRNSFIYGRDYQIVKREIVFLRLES